MTCSIFLFFLECGLISSAPFQNVISSKPCLVPRMWSACAKILVFATYPFSPQSSSTFEVPHIDDDDHTKYLGHVLLNPLLRRAPIPLFRHNLTLPCNYKNSFLLQSVSSDCHLVRQQQHKNAMHNATRTLHLQLYLRARAIVYFCLQPHLLMYATT